MKRIGNLYQSVCSLENLYLADSKARKGKGWQQGVRIHDQNRDNNLQRLHEALKLKTFETSRYQNFVIFEPKRREISRLPYFPDRIVHHAIMNILEPIWMKLFTADTYSSIKGKGIHAAGRKIKESLKDEEETMYCLKMDIKKFYPSVDHDILKSIIRKKIKDKDLIWLLDSIIDSAPGLPIGNYLSQYMANLYLTYFDHWIKETMKVKHYFRYCDDLVILGPDKTQLHTLRIKIAHRLETDLRLQVKPNAQVFPVDSRSIDFVGYRFYHTHTLLRKRIKQNFARAVAKRKGRESIAAYLGWAKHANCIHLTKKLLNNEKLQRFGHSIRIKRIRRRQDQNRQNFEPGDYSQRLPY